jgi:hypothetical protein
MIDMRYHVFSLVAVLLALGIGILLGTTLVERGLIAEQKSQIGSLKKTFVEIKAKNEELHAQMKVLEDFASQARPYLVANRLAGRSFAVLDRPGVSGDGLGRITEAISAAGGAVPVTIEIAGKEAYENPDVAAALAGLFQMPQDAQALEARVISEVANQVVTASNPALLTELDRLGVIRMSGSLPGPLSGAVLFSEDEKAGTALEQTDIPLIKTFVAAGFPLAGVGDEKTDPKVLTAYKDNGISTIERIDTVPGQVGMVMALEGRGGTYGSSAERLIPEPPGM